MKITSIDAWPVWNGKRNFLFVTVDTDEGISGVGEAGITWREHAVIGALDHMRPLLLGMDPFRTEYIWQLLFRGGFFPAQRIQTAAMSAIDIALWDIKGKALNVPVYELLGGLARDRVVCYPHNYGRGLEVGPLVETCLAATEAGWKFVRWDLPQDGTTLEPRQSVMAAIRQAQAVREAVGDVRSRLPLTCTRASIWPTRSGSVRNSNSIVHSSSKTRCAAKTRIHSKPCVRGRRFHWPPASSSARSGNSGS